LQVLYHIQPFKIEISNGHENPVVDKLLELYHEIKYIEGTIEEAISMMIYAYNFVHSFSTFDSFVIQFNKNLKNLYLYDIYNSNIKSNNFIIHKMIPSPTYLQLMKNKWNNTQKQRDLMINEKCITTSITSYFYKNNKTNFYLS